MREYKSLAELEQAILNPVNPDLPAITDAQKTIYWRDIPHLVKNWQDAALAQGIDNKNPILIYGHKEAEFVIAILACLLAKIPYIPADIAFPQARIDKILQIANVSAIYNAQTNKFELNAKRDFDKSLAEKDLAYIIFTSGSTGEPKGVQIGRESILGLINAAITDFYLDNNPVIMNQVHFSFDVSMFDTFAALFTNGHLVINARNEISEISTWYDKLRKNKIQIWSSTPAFAYQQLLNKDFRSDFLPSLKGFILAGEPLSLTLIKRLKKLFPDSFIINAYGPTEATVFATKIKLDLDKFDFQEIPIGKAMPNTKVYVDENRELCIIGANVMRGYINREDLNRQKLFIDKTTGLRGFKTGDMGHYDAENDLLYCKGRFDSQIKLHGYRIELDEIEKIFDDITGVHKSVILPLKKPDGSVLRILGFYQLSEAKDLETDFIKQQLAEKLPTYMIPSEFIKLDNLPTNTNNKIDRKLILEEYINN